MGETIKRLTRENHLLLRDNREEVLNDSGQIIGAEEDDELYGTQSHPGRTPMPRLHAGLALASLSS